jgi:hypothetical protein
MKGGGELNVGRFDEKTGEIIGECEATVIKKCTLRQGSRGGPEIIGAHWGDLVKGIPPGTGEPADIMVNASVSVVGIQNTLEGKKYAEIVVRSPHEELPGVGLRGQTAIGAARGWVEYECLNPDPEPAAAEQPRGVEGRRYRDSAGEYMEMAAANIEPSVNPGRTTVSAAGPASGSGAAAVGPEPTEDVLPPDQEPGVGGYSDKARRMWALNLGLPDTATIAQCKEEEKSRAGRATQGALGLGKPPVLAPFGSSRRNDPGAARIKRLEEQDRDSLRKKREKIYGVPPPAAAIQEELDQIQMEHVPIIRTGMSSSSTEFTSLEPEPEAAASKPAGEFTLNKVHSLKRTKPITYNITFYDVDRYRAISRDECIVGELSYEKRTRGTLELRYIGIDRYKEGSNQLYNQHRRSPRKTRINSNNELTSLYPAGSPDHTLKDGDGVDTVEAMRKYLETNLDKVSNDVVTRLCEKWGIQESKRQQAAHQFNLGVGKKGSPKTHPRQGDD